MDDCKPTCPCKARTSREAVNRVAKLLGIDEDHAQAMIGMLAFHGWHLVKDQD